MPVLDFHLHVGTRYHWNPWVISFFKQNNPEYIDKFVEEITPDGILTYLDSQEIDYAVVLSEYAPQTTGVVTNEFTSQFCKGSPRLIPFGAICLYDGSDLAYQVERCVKDLGCRGLKMLPTYAHFDPSDSKLWPAYEVARDLQIPLLFHTGSSIFKGSRIKYGNPLLLDDVADDFPELVIVMSHGGRPFWYTEAEWLLRRHKNMHIDISGIPPKQLLTIFPNLEKFQDRFVFGSDWPGIPSILDQVRKIQELPLSARTIDALLWENAARLLDIA